MIKIIEPSLEVIDKLPTEQELFNKLGYCAGLAYDSKRDSDDANKKRVLSCIRNGHLSVLEHFNFTVVVTTDRATTHALVRHRHCAFTQQSTIYCKYADCLTIIGRPSKDAIYDKDIPQWFDKDLEYYEECHKQYLQSIENGEPAGLARDALPNCTATKIAITTNLREWLWIAALRTDKADSTRMHTFAKQIADVLKENYPSIYEAYSLYEGNIK